MLPSLRRCRSTGAVLCVMTTTNTACDRFYNYHHWKLTHCHATLPLGCSHRNCRPIVNMVINLQINGPVYVAPDLGHHCACNVPAQHGGGARSAQAHCWPHSSKHRAWIRKYLRVNVFISLSLVGSPWWLLLISQVKQHKITTKLGMVNIVLDFSSASTLTMKGVG